MDTAKRIKLHAACRNTTMAAVLDYTTSAPFHHQTSLALSEGAHFDPCKRGAALAGAGRSALGDCGAAANLVEEIGREAHLRTLATQWPEIQKAFASDAELSGTNVNHLWAAVTFILTVRAGRATGWHVPEVEQACLHQLRAIPAYSAAVATTITRNASGFTGVENPRAINRAYLQFFLPFWWEHILRRGTLEPAAAEKLASSFLAPGPPVPPAPAPAPPLGYHVPPWMQPPPVYSPPYPGPAPMPQQTPAPHLTATPPAPPPPAPALSPGHNPPFLGKAWSKLICGNTHGKDPLNSNARLCNCHISRAFAGRTHYPFECPLRYHAQRGACPGWASNGTRLPGSWIGDELTPTCLGEWRALQATLTSAKMTGPAEVKF
jgi:hypothetical protein